MVPTIAHACEYVKNQPVNYQIFKCGLTLLRLDDYDIQIKF